MKYLKIYENFNNEKEFIEFFKDKIDWKLFRFLQNCTIDAVDAGFGVHIKIHTFFSDCFVFKYLNVNDIEYENYPNILLKDAIDDYNYIKKFKYSISLYGNPNKSGNEYLYEIINNIETRYKLSFYDVSIHQSSIYFSIKA